MTVSTTDVTVTLRIPGNWTDPGELLKQIPEGYRLMPDSLVLPDDSQVEFTPMPADDQFAQVFRQSMRRRATAEELQVIDNYTVNVLLSGSGGSLAAARRMMQAGASIVQAGGAGVFIDNCGLSHGAKNWLYMTEQGSSDAVSFAFVGIVRGQTDVWTMGMHVLGIPDVVMRRADADANEQAIIEVIRYCCGSDRRIEDGHLLGDEEAPWFRAESAGSDEFEPDSPMHNPFGRLRLVSMKDVAERN